MFSPGTPGTGKTTLGEELGERTSVNYFNVGNVAEKNDLYEGWDSEYQCHILDEDKVRSTIMLFSKYLNQLQAFPQVYKVLKNWEKGLRKSLRS